MGERAWRPGDVAMVRNEYDVWNRAICAVRVGTRGFVWAYGVADSWASMDADARPLVVIDPVVITGPEETLDADPVREIADCLANLASAERATANSGSYRGRVAARLSATFAAVLAPEKPEEPTGLGAVVEDARGHIYVRLAPPVAGARWPDAVWSDDGSTEIRYADIAAIKVLSEGVTA